jgi:transcriptional repressor NrdR
MKCVFCGYNDSKVVDSRNSDEQNSIRRRRECLKCGKRFTTYEMVESSPILVIKNDGSRQTFDPQKIKRGIIKACEKRPVSMNQIDEIIVSIERQINNSLAQEVKSSEIGEMVMTKLKAIDEISYVRFAAVYRKFKDITTFISFLNNIN